MNQSNLALEASDTIEIDAFFDKIAGLIDAGAAGLMLSLGHRLGLFDTMAGLPPSTSTQIAERAELAERYVREWLAAMVVSGVVRYDPAARTYRLPPAHAACLTRDAPMGNMAVYAQFLAMAGGAHDALVECFETGAGLGYERYPDFHRIMAEDSAQTVVANLPELLSQLVPDVVDRLRAGAVVLDAGCGAGGAVLAMARAFPASEIHGVDLGADAIALASAEAARRGLANARFEVADLNALGDTGRFDLVTSFDAIHDTPEPRDTLANLYAALVPGGVHLMQDIGGSARLENNIDFPFAAFLYTVSTFHCTPVSLSQGGCGLGTMWGWETAEAMLREVGFASVERHVLEHDPMNVWFVNRKESA